MKKFIFWRVTVGEACYSVEAETLAEAKALLEDDPGAYFTDHDWEIGNPADFQCEEGEA